jgi:hypothetical protein
MERATVLLLATGRPAKCDGAADAPTRAELVDP